MTKSQKAAEQARSDLDARLAIYAEDARREAESATVRAETEILIADEKQRLALARLERQAQQAATGEHELTAGSGFWSDRLRVQGEPVPEPAEISADMTMEQYREYRDAAGIGRHGIENLSRRPGVTSASSSDSGFADWSDRSANRMVFRGDLGERYR